MSVDDSTQFASVAPHYNEMLFLPEAEVLETTLGGRLHKADLRGSRVLDLACGTGRWSRYAVHEGAAEVVGVDLSPAMVDAARRASASEIERRRIKYVVADGSQPLHGPLFDEPFDLILAICFLNYAASEQEMLNMWRVIFQNLAPNGQVICLVPNLNLEDDYSEPIDPRYGTSFRKLESINVDREDWGFKTRFTAYTRTRSVYFDMFRLNRDVYTRTAQTVGLQEIRFQEMQYPTRGHAPDYWAEYKRRPHYELLTAGR